MLWNDAPSLSLSLSASLYTSLSSASFYTVLSSSSFSIVWRSVSLSSILSSASYFVYIFSVFLSLHFRVLLSKILCRLLRCRHDSRSGVGGLGPGSVLSDLVRWFLRLLGVVPPLQPRPDGGGYHAVVGSRIRGGLGAFLHFIHHHCMPELI